MKTKKTKKVSIIQRIILGVSVLLAASGMGIAGISYADRFEEQIKQIQSENAVNQDRKEQLWAEASSYQDQVNKLQAEITALQNQIETLQIKRTEKEAEIAKAEADLAEQKRLLGLNIRAMYLEGQISTLEILATSKNLSEFVDKQEYREVAKSKIENTVDKITLLKNELRGQKEELERVIADQKRLQDGVATQKAESQRLLSLTVDQKAEVESGIKANNARIADLRRQQAEENARLFAQYGGASKGIPGGGGYPGVWAFAPMDSLVDSWGMYNRECVSYTAWKVADSGRYMPYWGGIGNANQWDNNARAAGIPVDGNPRVGDVAQIEGRFWGDLGHVMYVEHVYGDGTIFVSQYNGFNDGTYSTGRVNQAGLTFIHFP